MPTLEQRLAAAEFTIKQLQAVAAAMQGQPASATISVPHNDSWLFEDNLDATHPGNLRYVIAANVQRVVSARLSIHLAPYRTYNSLSLTTTGIESATHSHTVNAHHHDVSMTFVGAAGATVSWGGINGSGLIDNFSSSGNISTNNISPGTGGDSVDHNHTVTGTAVLGVTEGATATGVTIAFDGVDQTVVLGGPFNADAIELNVLPYLPLTQGVFHVIAMTPSGLGRIEAHLRLGVYVAAGSVF